MIHEEGVVSVVGYLRKTEKSQFMFCVHSLFMYFNVGRPHHEKKKSIVS